MKPLLAYTIENVAKLKFPLAVSPKLDGIRCIIMGGVALSRTLKPIPNEHVQSLFGRPELNGLDGELIVGSPTDKDCYRNTNSGVMSKDGVPDVTFHVFDHFEDTSAPFSGRFVFAKRVADCYPFMPINMVKHNIVSSVDGLLEYEQQQLELGYEGVMCRSIEGRYKMGRSTEKEGILGKLKRFVDSDFKVVGFQERMHNANEAVINELGYTERSSHKENKIGRGDLGALTLEMENGDTFSCGSGFNDAERAELWAVRDTLIGKVVKVKHFDYGTKDVVRFPTFLGFRED